MGKNIKVMILENKMNNQHQLHRLKKSDYLRLCIGNTLQGKHIRIFTNFPMHSNIFLRDTYHELEIINPTPSKNQYDSFDNYAELKATLSGAFQFYFTENGSGSREERVGEGYFIIDPRFTFETSAKDRSLHWELDGLVVQTYLAKCLGPMEEWRARIEAAISGNYNMVHFTPLQELGYSRSAYSIRDQLVVNPWFSSKESGPVTWETIESFVRTLNDEQHMLSMTDLVYNHTSNDSPWLHEHPECAYNLINSPHLRPAYLLDRAVWNLTLELEQKKYAHLGLSDTVTEPRQVDIIRDILWQSIHKLRLHEFFLADIDSVVADFRVFLKTNRKIKNNNNNNEDDDNNNNKSLCSTNGNLKLNHGGYYRFKSTVDNEAMAAEFYDYFWDVEAACVKCRELLAVLNEEKKREVESHLEAAVGNVVANINYRFIDEGGLRLVTVGSRASPLMWNYFYHPFEAVVSLAECEERMEGEARIMAFNGWVMNHDPLGNFAEAGSNVYLRRELIVWGDSVKLRYGESEADCPYLWKRMAEYTERTASIFHGVRLDNCHGTPIHVCQVMLDRARAVRPDLYIVAELFTGSEAVDNIFVNKLGINSLIRECQSAWDCREEGRLVHKYGGSLPVGSFVQQSPQQLHPSTAHALFYDMTHDNESPITKRSLYDYLPSAAIVGVACCAIGSTRGFDEMVPHYIDVVNEERFYSPWNNSKGGGGGGMGFDTSIVKAKSIINKLHHRLAAQHYNEVFVDQLDDHVVAVTRLSPSLYKSVIVVAHSVFHFEHKGEEPQHRYIKEINISGRVRNILLEARTKSTDQSVLKNFKKHKSIINGLADVVGEVRENIVDITQSTMVSVVSGDDNDTVFFTDFPPGSVIILEVDMISDCVSMINRLKHDLATQFNVKLRSGSVGQCLINELMVEEQLSRPKKHEEPKESSKDTTCPSLRELLGELSLNDLNRLLYRCHEEEMAEFGSGTYDVGGYGRLVFCGLQGVVSEMATIRANNDLGHPLCNNLRQGDWLMDYIANRLFKFKEGLKKVGQWFQIMFSSVKKLPRYMVPTYFDMVVSCAHKLALEECYYQLGDEVVFGSSFLKSLALGSVMLCSEMRNCTMPPLAIKLSKERSTLSAGFPHFAEGIWRNWGRDTFIALRGLLILTGRFEDARSIILTYAATMRHGLIPNLLGDGFISRYNARDATWFWLNSIKEYEQHSRQNLDENEENILSMPVSRMYVSDGADGHNIVEQSLCDVIQEVLQRHADGINFHERNAGIKIDEQMKENGFYVKAGIRNSTKFPYGGNEFNCGTWMDKMGSSEHSGNKGRPATPRDGSAVELVGLCASVLEWLIELFNERKYPHAGVQYKGQLLSWSDWYSTIKEFFDDMFYIPLNADDAQLKSNRGIYRDSVNSTHGYTDSQFRPNFLVAMTVAPSLFNLEHAWHALQLVEKELLGVLGMRTLCPRDWAYRGYYDNSNNSTDPSVSHGFNYHQGPEWLWLTGYYIRAKLIFSRKIHDFDPSKYPTTVDDTIVHVTQVFGRLQNHINNSRWRSLPELTNKDGAFCHHSCEAQAWSVGCALEALHDLISLSN